MPQVDTLRLPRPARVALACTMLGWILPAHAMAADAPRTLRVALVEAPPVPNPGGWMAVIVAVIAEWRRHGADLRVADASRAPEGAPADLSWAREVFGHDLDPELLSVAMRVCGAAGCRVSAVLNEAGHWHTAPVPAGAAPVAAGNTPAAAAPEAAGAVGNAPVPATPGAAAPEGGARDSSGTPDRLAASAATYPAQDAAHIAMSWAGEGLPAAGAAAGAAEASVAAAPSPGAVQPSAPGGPGVPAPRGPAAAPAPPRPWTGLAAPTAAALPWMVAHEIGHLLGLEHDDTSSGAGGSLMAMAAGSAVVTTGYGPGARPDVAGLSAAARSAAAVAAAGALFPPRNETFDFRATLEQKYRGDLGRQPLLTFVDVEGSVVWVQEYLRYRLDGCPHGEAAARVLRQILGAGVQPSCGSGSWSGAPPFPPRNETFAFRQQLEEVYGGTLGRGTVFSAVDPEGDVVWTQEYLRYRLSGCTHGLAVGAVLAQVDGLPAPPACVPAGSPAPGPPVSGDVVENPRRLVFFSPEHVRFSAYQVGFFPPGAGAPVQVVVVPLGVVQQVGTEQVIDLAVAGLLPPVGQIFTFRARGVWSGGVTAWSDPSQPFIRR